MREFNEFKYLFDKIIGKFSYYLEEFILERY